VGRGWAQGVTSTRSGLGFDLHPLVDGRPLVLGGVAVPYERGLGGHSDADVLTHAVCEALLGAMALGDLGRMFPDTDPRWKDVSSLVLLEGVLDVLRARRATLVNVDATLICQTPRLGSHLPAMAARLAQTLGVEPDRVSVKAKSPEHLGHLGRGEGIAALAVVSVEVP
jgi:2-C-methyl-D-erythritol 2,4-cyclodiphosphate synthase